MRTFVIWFAQLSLLLLASTPEATRRRSSSGSRKEAKNISKTSPDVPKKGTTTFPDVPLRQATAPSLYRAKEPHDREKEEDKEKSGPLFNSASEPLKKNVKINPSIDTKLIGASSDSAASTGRRRSPSGPSSELTGLSLTLNFTNKDEDETLSPNELRRRRGREPTEVKYSDAQDGQDTKKTITITGLKQKVPGKLVNSPSAGDVSEDENPLRRRFMDHDAPTYVGVPTIMMTGPQQPSLWTPPANRRKITSKKIDPRQIAGITSPGPFGDFGGDDNDDDGKYGDVAEQTMKLMGGGKSKKKQRRRPRNKDRPRRQRRVEVDDEDGEDEGDEEEGDEEEGMPPQMMMQPFMPTMYMMNPQTGQPMAVPMAMPMAYGYPNGYNPQLMSHPDDEGQDDDKDELEENKLIRAIARTGRQRVVMINLYRFIRIMFVAATTVAYFMVFNFALLPNINPPNNNNTNA